MTTNSGQGVSAGLLARMSLFGLAVTALAGCFTIVVLPTRVEDLVAESSKNTALGVLSFVGLVIAVLVQPIAGGASDRKTSRWGRRVPFIAIGGMASVPLLIAVGAAPNYALLFLLTCILQLFSNAAQGPYQALIRDYVPHAKRGAASGVKWLVEIVPAIGIVALVAWLIGRYDESREFSWVWLALTILAALLAVGVAVSVAALRRAPPPVNGPAVEAGPAAKAHPHYKCFLASRFLLALAASSLQTFLLFILEDRMGIENPAQELWKIFAVTGAGAFLVLYPAARLSDRMGRKPILLASGGGWAWRRAASCSRPIASRPDARRPSGGARAGHVPGRELGPGERPGLRQARGAAAGLPERGHRGRGGPRAAQRHLGG